MRDKGFVAVFSRVELAQRFEQTIVLESGKVVEQGLTEDLLKSDGVLHTMLKKN